MTRDDAPAKPDPAGLRLFLTQWQVAPHDVLYVGDSRFDVVCGKLVGVPVALYTGERPGRVMVEDADFSFSDYHQLLEFI